MSPAVSLFSSYDIQQKYEIYLRSSIYLDDSHLTTITEQYIFSDDTHLPCQTFFSFPSRADVNKAWRSTSNLPQVLMTFAELSIATNLPNFGLPRAFPLQQNW